MAANTETRLSAAIGGVDAIDPRVDGGRSVGEYCVDIGVEEGYRL